LLKKIIKGYLFVDYWNIGIAKAPINDFLNEEKPNIEWFPLKSKKYFIADSFAIADKYNKDKLHIFAEIYHFKGNKGIIQHILYEKKTGFFEPTTVLENETHLSYPYIIEDEDDIYLLPENKEENKVKLYKATSFPLKWDDGSDGSSSYKLNLFYSDNLESDQWEVHPQNPITIDIACSRSAGTPFEHNNVLYRPSMDYSEKLKGKLL